MVEYTHQTKDGKLYYTYELDNGDVIRVYESGTEYNETRGYIHRGAITKENAKIMQKQSREAIKQNALDAAREGLLRGVGAREIVDSSPYIAWSHIIAAQAELALSPDMGHSSTKAAEFVGKAADMLPDRRSANVTLSDGQNTVQFQGIEPEEARQLLDAIRGERELRSDNQTYHPQVQALPNEAADATGEEEL